MMHGHKNIKLDDKLFTSMISKSSEASKGLHSRTLREILTGASDPKWQIKLK
jgi:hypothetical protein